MSRITVLTLVTLLGLGSSTHAQDTARVTAATTAAQPDEGPTLSRVSIGAGIGFGGDPGFSGTLGGTSSGLGAFATPRGFSPFGTALVELAINPHLRMGLGVNGSYSSTTHRNDGPGGSFIGPKKSASFGGAVTARWVFNPGGVVEVSPILGVGAHWGTAKGIANGVTYDAQGNATYSKAHGDGYGIDARLGLVLERELLPQLFLRFENYLLRAGYDESDLRTKLTAKTQKEHLAQTSINVAWTPILQLRLTF